MCQMLATQQQGQADVGAVEFRPGFAVLGQITRLTDELLSAAGREHNEIARQPDARYVARRCLFDHRMCICSAEAERTHSPTTWQRVSGRIMGWIPGEKFGIHEKWTGGEIDVWIAFAEMQRRWQRAVLECED